MEAYYLRNWDGHILENGSNLFRLSHEIYFWTIEKIKEKKNIKTKTAKNIMETMYL